MDPHFLDLADVLEIHADQIRRYGGEGGIRDLGLLESALGTVTATFEGRFLNSDIFEMAGAYLYHIAQNHPFVDGNKRTATAAALVFLVMNGLELVVPPERLTRLVWALAAGEVSKAQATDFFRKHSQPI